MKYTTAFLVCILFSFTASAQTITLGPISKLAYCVGDTLVIPYQSSGNFVADNTFIAQLSDGNGSFAGFTNGGSNSATSGSISVRLGATGLGFRVRVASTDPYLVSGSNGADIKVYGSASPQPFVSRNGVERGNLTDFGDVPILGMTGDVFKFYDNSVEPAGTSWLWQFDSTASVTSSTDSSPVIEYSTDDIKIGSLTVTNPAGCSSKISYFYYVLSCNPIIPKGVHTVTSTSAKGSGNDVLVKTGGAFTTTNIPGQRIFVEQGGSVIAGENGWGIFYLMPGSSFKTQGGNSANTIVMTSGTSDIIGQPPGYIDTFFCNNLTFDYSQIPSSVADNPAPKFSLIQSGDHLFANSEETPAEIRILNILGAEVLSQHGTGELDVDLSPLPAGVYFAQVQSGDAREVRKIAVVH